MELLNNYLVLYAAHTYILERKSVLYARTWYLFPKNHPLM